MEKICNNLESGCTMNCFQCEVPTYEPEWCENCSRDCEENGIDYEFNVFWEDGGWTCEDCGGGC